MGYDGEMQSEKMPLPMVMQRADKADTQTMEQCAKLVGAHWNDKYGAEFARGDKFERMAAVYVDNTVRSILPIQPGQSFKPVPWGDTPIILFEAQGHPMQSLEHSRRALSRKSFAPAGTLSKRGEGQIQIKNRIHLHTNLKRIPCICIQTLICTQISVQFDGRAPRALRRRARSPRAPQRERRRRARGRSKGAPPCQIM